MKDIKQVIIVRKDLNLRKNELASHVATASMGFLLENNE
jgi:peptidyl-tRNA hydrolase